MVGSCLSCLCRGGFGFPGGGFWWMVSGLEVLFGGFLGTWFL